jgi:hypothetical protein
MRTYHLLITIAVNGMLQDEIIQDITKHYIEDGLFIFEKSGRKNFVTMNNVLYFGSLFDFGGMLERIKGVKCKEAGK